MEQDPFKRLIYDDQGQSEMPFLRKIERKKSKENLVMNQEIRQLHESKEKFRRALEIVKDIIGQIPTANELQLYQLSLERYGHSEGQDHIPGITDAITFKYLEDYFIERGGNLKEYPDGATTEEQEFIRQEVARGKEFVGQPFKERYALDFEKIRGEVETLFRNVKEVLEEALPMFDKVEEAWKNQISAELQNLGDFHDLKIPTEEDSIVQIQELYGDAEKLYDLYDQMWNEMLEVKHDQFERITPTRDGNYLRRMGHSFKGEYAADVIEEGVIEKRNALVLIIKATREIIQNFQKVREYMGEQIIADQKAL